MRRGRGLADWGLKGVSPGAQGGGCPLMYPPSPADGGGSRAWVAVAFPTVGIAIIACPVLVLWGLRRKALR